MIKQKVKDSFENSSLSSVRNLVSPLNMHYYPKAPNIENGMRVSYKETSEFPNALK